MNRNILLLGIVSFLTDISSEMIMPVLPLFLSSLGGGGIVIGIVGGLGDSVASMLKVFSGYFSDKYGNRKRFVFAGYGLSSVAKLFFGFATSAWQLIILRPMERLGKGIRTAPRDSIIAESAPVSGRGKGFGFHRAMDNLGAVIGSFLALILVVYYSLTYNAIFLLAGAISFTALIPIIWVTEKKIKQRKASIRLGFSSLSGQLKLFILASSVFSMANFTYMFYILRAEQLFGAEFGLAVPLVLYILLNIAETALSTHMGSLSDRIGRRKVIAAGYGIFILMSAGFFLSSSLWVIIALFMVYGLVLSMVDASERALVSDLARKEYRATALGAYHTSVGLATLPGGILAGAIWDIFGSVYAFAYGAAFGLIAFLMILSVPRSIAASH